MRSDLFREREAYSTRMTYLELSLEVLAGSPGHFIRRVDSKSLKVIIVGPYIGGNMSAWRRLTWCALLTCNGKDSRVARVDSLANRARDVGSSGGNAKESDDDSNTGVREHGGALEVNDVGMESR